jgi:hypothetical protein
VFGAVTLAHPAFAERSADPFWGAGFMLLAAPQCDATVITMTTPATPEGGPDDAWDWVTDLARGVCDVIGADFGVINGFATTSGQSHGGTPFGPEVAPGRPPGVVCPWNYWGAARRSDAGFPDRLEAVAGVAAVCELTPAGGWVLQPRDEYSGSRPDDVLTALGVAWEMQPPLWLGMS